MIAADADFYYVVMEQLFVFSVFCSISQFQTVFHFNRHSDNFWRVVHDLFYLVKNKLVNYSNDSTLFSICNNMLLGNL